jgi:membrane-bound lytic murein transglycosylase F
MKKLFYLVIPFLVVLFFLSQQKSGFFAFGGASIDLKEIETKGSLVVATCESSSDFFLYKGEPLGFQLEVMEDLCSYLGVKVEVLKYKNQNELWDALRYGKCDMIAGSLNTASFSEDYALTSVPLLETDLLLVQRKSENGQRVDSLNKLQGRAVYMPAMFSQDKLLSLATSTKIQLIQMPQYTQSNLIDLVKEGKIDYAICNNILARGIEEQYPSLDFKTVINKAQQISWVFRSQSKNLHSKVNDWLSSYKTSTRFSVLLDKYYNYPNQMASSKNRYYAISGSRISEYDDLIKKYSAELKWDWRLLASLICQESRFNPTVKSHRGAFGLMQLMPSTLQRFGIDTTATPEEQIKAGVKFLKFLNKSLTSKVKDPQERINFILASYNIGPGHIFDAQKLAKKLGKDPQKWFNNVDTCLLSKSDPENYNDPMVEHGYCKGKETFSFVQEVMDRYLHYKEVYN